MCLRFARVGDDRHTPKVAAGAARVDGPRRQSAAARTQLRRVYIGVPGRSADRFGINDSYVLVGDQFVR